MDRIEVYWKALGTAGFEHCVVESDGDGIRADGIFLRNENGAGWRTRYELRFDRAWRAREVRVESLDGATSLHMHSDGGGTWRDARERMLVDLHDCVDVDIMATPFPNGAAIERLALAPGQSAVIQAAYIELPRLSVVRMPQRYTRLDARRYRYESLRSEFSAELVLDANGIVASFEGIWEQV